MFTMLQQNIKQKLKTFEVYHMESNDGFNDRYYNGKIEAMDIDHAIEIFTKEWIKEEYQNDIDVESIDEDGSGNQTAILTGLTDYSDENGNYLSMDEIEQLEKLHDMEIGDLIDNGKLGYLDHGYEIIEVDPINEDYENDIVTPFGIVRNPFADKDEESD